MMFKVYAESTGAGASATAGQGRPGGVAVRRGAIRTGGTTRRTTRGNATGTARTRG